MCRGGVRCDWVGLDWIGLDWIGLDWVGLDWIGLDWIGWVAFWVWISAIGHTLLNNLPGPTLHRLRCITAPNPPPQNTHTPNPTHE